MNFERNVNFMDRSREALCHALRQLFTAQYMIVHVLHGLAGVFSAVVDDAVAALLQIQRFGYSGAGTQAGRQLMVGQVGIVRHVGRVLFCSPPAHAWGPEG